jgi:hypothetical protein
MAGEGRAETRGIRHQTRCGFFLRGLGDERNLFCELTTVKMDHGKLVTGRRLGRSSTAVGMASGSSPAPRTPPVVAVLVGDPPPSDESAREAPVQRLDGSVVARQWRLGFGQIRTG